MKKAEITPANLNGRIWIPASKSLCHRAIIAAGLAKGESNIDNVTSSDDINATCAGMTDMGVNMQRKDNGLTINGDELLNGIKGEIDCIESGSTLRFLIPLVLTTGEKVTFKGRGNLKSRPLTPYYKIFEEQNIKYDNSNGLPLTVEGMLNPGEYEVPGNISSQFITGLLFALPLLKGDSKIIITNELESKSYVDLTIDILKKFSVMVKNNKYKEFIIKGNQKYVPVNYKVEGDFSQAAFWLVAGILGGEVECVGVDTASLQGDKVIVDFIKEMGGIIIDRKDSLLAKISKTKGITIDAHDCPDLVPVLAVLGALSEGTTNIVNAGRLRIKESDRLKAIATELTKLGADIKETENGLTINGKEMLKGGEVDSWNDHRIAMALSIASIRCENPVIINNSSAVKKSYPEFYKHFSLLGGMLDERNMG